MPYYGSSYGNSGGSKMRIIIAVVIALIGVITYMTNTQTNPVTNEKQHVSWTAEQEMALGLEAAPEMAREMGGWEDPAASPDARRVSDVGLRLVASSVASKSPYVKNFHFHLLRDPKTINAFALPGGQIFITRGLYSKLTNEAQLAGVLGHEIGHVIHRHGAEHMASTQLGNALVTAVGVGASDDRGHGVTAQMAAAMANQMLQLKYSRSDELESDQFGLVAMVSASLDPKSMLRVMEILQEASKGRSGAQIFATHPDPEARMVAIRAFLDKNYPNGTPSNLTPGRPLQSAEAEFQSNWRSPAPKLDRDVARDTRSRDTRRPAASYELHP